MRIAWYRRTWVAVAAAAVGLLVVAAAIAGATAGPSSHNGKPPSAETPSASALPTVDAGTTPGDAPSELVTSTPAPTPAPAGGCSADPMVHVYNPDRLHVLAACITVSGTVTDIRSEADGDYHVLIQLDPGQTCDGQDCLDGDNYALQNGQLVVEAVCEHTITQSDAISACSGYHNALAIPPRGTHTTATGPWVHDGDHGWNEIHPVERFGGEAASTQPAASAAPTAPPGRFSVSITTSRYGYVAAVTTPGAVCSAKAVLPSGRVSTAQGLQVQDTAGPDGSVSWSYRTSTSSTPGTGTHTVTCSLGGATASASAPFTVA